jgi:hypothetical protein
MREHLWPFFLATRNAFDLVDQTSSIIEVYGTEFAINEGNDYVQPGAALGNS